MNEWCRHAFVVVKLIIKRINGIIYRSMRYWLCINSKIHLFSWWSNPLLWFWLDIHMYMLLCVLTSKWQNESYYVFHCLRLHTDLHTSNYIYNHSLIVCITNESIELLIFNCCWQFSTYTYFSRIIEFLLLVACCCDTFLFLSWMMINGTLLLL